MSDFLNRFGRDSFDDDFDDVFAQPDSDPDQGALLVLTESENDQLRAQNSQLRAAATTLIRHLQAADFHLTSPGYATCRCPRCQCVRSARRLVESAGLCP